MNNNKNNTSLGKINYKWLALLTVAINGFIIVLDISVVNLSFPILTKVFNTEPAIILWVAVTYSLMAIGLMPILGNIADIYGKKNIFILGFIIFTVGLALCSVSQNIVQLILSRVIQGIGGAMNMALGFALVTEAFPVQERGKALGIMSSVFSIGPLVGVTAGGFLLDAVGWRSVFYVRVPICIIGIFMAWRLLSEDKSLKKSSNLDLFGAGALFCCLSCLFLYMNFGGRMGFASPRILLLAGISLASFVIFILQEKRIDQPVVDLTLFHFHPGTLCFSLGSWGCNFHCSVPAKG